MELPDLARRAELVRRYAHLLQHFGSEIGERPLVRQNNAFFPDPFQGDEASVARLVRRLQAHGGLEDIPVTVQLASLDAPELDGNGCKTDARTSGCGSGACAPAPAAGKGAARLIEGDAGWVLNVFESELHHPVALTCTLARALARVFLAETESARAPVEAPLDVSVDLASVALGFGTLALQGSYIYAKSCGGPSVTQLTQLGVGELAVACSLFIALGRHSGRRAAVELDTTQRALLAEANDWAASNPRLIEALANNPGQLAATAPTLHDTRPWLLRLFDRKPARAASVSMEAALAGELGEAELLELAQAARGKRREAPAAAHSSPSAEDGRSNSRPRADASGAGPAKDGRRDELRALVDEALRSS
jgi:hypothetical protein